MTRTAVIVICACALARVSGAQIASLPTEQTGAHMVRAAGMPLNDGTLPPGMLTVRVVEGGFTRDLTDQLVTVAVEGGKSESARTGADGRAQFAHLPVGARVRTSATIGTERLESDAFEMPAASGVRILLVALEAAAGAGAVEATVPPALPTSVVSAPPIPSEPAWNDSRDDVAVTAIRAVLATSTVCALVAFGVVRRPRRRSSMDS